jgi:uncharacterized RDD family membrane protein YckC
MNVRLVRNNLLPRRDSTTAASQLPTVIVRQQLASIFLLRDGMYFESAPFWRRLLARVLDLAFALVLTFVLVIPVSLLMFPFMPLVDRDWWTSVGAATCYFLAYVALESFLLVRRRGQTLGKGLMGLRVISSRHSAAPNVTLQAALSRLVVLFLPFVLVSLAGANPGSAIMQSLGNLAFVALIVSLVLAALAWSYRRALHDYASGTRVVAAPRRKVVLRDDLRMMVPGKVDLTKRL